MAKDATIIIRDQEVKVKDLTIGDIIAWCREHDQVAWLKETAAKKVPYEIYPRIKVDGKSCADKTQAPKIEMRPISFVQIKSAFLEEFKLSTPKEKKSNMYDIIAAL